MPTSPISLTRVLYQGLLQLVYPKVCWSCGVSLAFAGGSFCDDCRAALTTDPHQTCPRCSSTVGPYVPLNGGCTTCRNHPFRFDLAIRLGPYAGRLRDLILRIKKPNGEELAEVLGLLWAECAAPRLAAFQADLVVPVPLHWRRRWARGYNQAETLARMLARPLSLPCFPRCLRRIRNTPHQTTTNSSRSRQDNVRGAFRVRSHIDLTGKTVLLVDDVLTTGSTASESARALKKAGAVRIVVAVLAHGS